MKDFDLIPLVDTEMLKEVITGRRIQGQVRTYVRTMHIELNVHDNTFSLKTTLLTQGNICT